MLTTYIGQIILVAFNFAPVGWLLCQGQLLSISQYEALFQLIGTTYGGDGQQTFKLPNLQSRVPVHMGTSNIGGTYVIGQIAGVESVTLTIGQIPQHNHMVNATASGQQLSPLNAYPANATSPTQAGVLVYGAPPAAFKINPATVQNAGGSLPHNNLQPFVAVNYIISLFGIYPSVG